MSERITILPERRGETDDERRLRETINRLGGQMLAALDSAINFRIAPQQAQKARNIALTKITDFSLCAMNALAHCEEPKETG